MTILHRNTDFDNSQNDTSQGTSTAEQLLRQLHDAPELPEVHSVFWTPNGGQTGEKKLSAWRTRGEPLAPPAEWMSKKEPKNIYFGVNPSAVRREDWQSSTNDTIGASRCFLAEFDGKDFVLDAEWKKLYVAPDLDKVAADARAELESLDLTEERMAQRVAGRQRGALQRAQTAAIDAAYKLAPDAYKARALDHIKGLAQRPNALWDSGGGYQGVWIFNKTIYLYNPDGTRNFDAYERLTALQKKWTAYVGGDPAASDIRRILRFPDSINSKPKYAPNYPVVEFVWCDLENEYDFDALVDLLPADAPRRQRRIIFVPAGAPVALGEMGDLPDLPRHFAIDELNRTTDLRTLFLEYGYTEARGNRLSRPGADTAGVELHDNNTATIFSSADPLFCNRRIRPADVIVMYDHGGDADKFLATLPEIRTLKEALAAERLWLASPDAIEEFKEAEFKNPEQARKLYDSILQKCEQSMSLRIAPGYAYLQKESGIALGGLSRYLARLFSAGFINLKMGKKGGAATEIELVLRNVNSKALTATPIHVAQNWNVYREQRSSEAFMNNHHAYKSTRTKATLPTLGNNGLGALLALLDGPATIKEAAEEVGYSYGAMARTLSRYADNGLVEIEVGERNLKTYTLKDDWRDILKANLPKMPTYAVQLVRGVKALERRVKYLKGDGNLERAAKVEVEHARLEAILIKVKKAAGIIPFVRPERVDAPQPVRRRIHLTLDRTTVRRVTKMTAGAKWRRREYAKTRAAAESNWAEFSAWAAVEYGPNWMVKLDQTDVLGRYQAYEYARDRVPTISWVGNQPAAQPTLYGVAA